MNPTNSLPIMEHFLTIQGEGAHTGRAAYFIRLAGCDVGCHWCDVKESWEAKSEQLTDISQIIETAKTSKAPIAVITGGEPSMHNLSYITAQLKKAGLKTHLETSGAYPITGEFDWVCVSPKKRKPPLKESLDMADELKVIIYNKDDFKWAETCAELVTPQLTPKLTPQPPKGGAKDCKLFLQPEWSKINMVTPWITEYIKQNPHWQVSLQIHKFMNIP